MRFGPRIPANAPSWGTRIRNGGRAAPFGGREGLLGTNPLSFGFPNRDGLAMLVDFATTAGRVIACVFHAMRSAGRDEQRAADAVIDVVLEVTA